jgi:hypothetical protein
MVVTVVQAVAVLLTSQTIKVLVIPHLLHHHKVMMELMVLTSTLTLAAAVVALALLVALALELLLAMVALVQQIQFLVHP